MPLSRDRLAVLRHVAEQAGSMPAPFGPWWHRYHAEFVPGVVLELLDMAGRAAKPEVASYVWVAPGRRSGEACIGGTRIPSEMIAAAVWRDGLSAASAWDVTPESALVACWYHAVHGRKRWRKRWGAWATENHGSLWSGQYSNVPAPPRRAQPEAT